MAAHAIFAHPSRMGDGGRGTLVGSRSSAGESDPLKLILAQRLIAEFSRTAFRMTLGAIDVKRMRHGRRIHTMSQRNSVLVTSNATGSIHLIDWMRHHRRCAIEGTSLGSLSQETDPLLFLRRRSIRCLGIVQHQIQCRLLQIRKTPRPISVWSMLPAVVIGIGSRRNGGVRTRLGFRIDDWCNQVRNGSALSNADEESDQRNSDHACQREMYCTGGRGFRIRLDRFEHGSFPQNKLVLQLLKRMTRTA